MTLLHYVVVSVPDDFFQVVSRNAFAGEGYDAALLRLAIQGVECSRVHTIKQINRRKKK